MRYDDLDLRQFKLINGESILAVVLHETHDNLTIEKPVLIHSKGNGSVVFTFWMPYTQEKIHVISQKHVIITSTVSEIFKEQYLNLYDEIFEDQELDGLDEEDYDAILSELDSTDASIH